MPQSYNHARGYQRSGRWEDAILFRQTLDEQQLDMKEVEEGILMGFTQVEGIRNLKV